MKLIEKGLSPAPPERRVVTERESSKWLLYLWKVLKWGATVVGLTGSMLVALQHMDIAYFFILPANFLWASIAFHRRMWSLLVANSAYMAFNIIGVLHWVWGIKLF